MESPETRVGKTTGTVLIFMMEILLYGPINSGLRSLLIHPLYQELMNGYLYFQSALPLEECGLVDGEETRKSTDFSPL